MSDYKLFCKKYKIDKNYREAIKHADINDKYESIGNLLFDKDNYDICMLEIENELFGFNSELLNFKKDNDIEEDIEEDNKDSNIQTTYKKCCSKQKLNYHQEQTRSGDEPMTLFIQC